MIAWALIAVISVLPISAGPYVTDVLRLISLARGGDGWQCWKLSLASSTLNAEGVPLREWDRAALQKAAFLTGGQVQDRFRANLVAYLAAIDRREYEEAAQFLETVLSVSGQIGAPTRSRVFLEAGFFQAWRRQNAALGRAWFEDAGKAKGVDRHSVAAAESGVLFAEGRFAEAAAKAEFAIARLERRVVGTATTQQAINELREIVERSKAARSGS